MQTFLPWINPVLLRKAREYLDKGQYKLAINTLYRMFRVCVGLLDYRRLGKQRVEAMQLIDACTNTGSQSWRKHPCAKMWMDHIECLKVYYLACVDEWKAQGYTNNMKPRNITPNKLSIPNWLGDDAFHESHRSNLKRKDPEYYGFLRAREDLEYVWN